jgi:hypothetical protein
MQSEAQLRKITRKDTPALFHIIQKIPLVRLLAGYSLLRRLFVELVTIVQVVGKLNWNEDIDQMANDY